MEENYRIIPKKVPPTFPEPEKRGDQYDQPIGPNKQTTADRIAHAARSAGTVAGNAVRQFNINPTVQKAKEVVRDRAEVFEHNISLQHREQPRTQQPPAQRQPTKLQHKYKPHAGQVRAVHPPPQRLAAQDDPFNLHGNNEGEPLGRGFVPLGKRQNIRSNDDPFGLRR
jgi:hypothetical protein